MHRYAPVYLLLSIHMQVLFTSMAWQKFNVSEAQLVMVTIYIIPKKSLYPSRHDNSSVEWGYYGQPWLTVHGRMRTDAGATGAKFSWCNWGVGALQGWAQQNKWGQEGTYPRKIFWKPKVMGWWYHVAREDLKSFYISFLGGTADLRWIHQILSLQHSCGLDVRWDFSFPCTEVRRTMKKVSKVVEAEENLSNNIEFEWRWWWTKPLQQWFDEFQDFNQGS